MTLFALLLNYNNVEAASLVRLFCQGFAIVPIKREVACRIQYFHVELLIVSIYSLCLPRCLLTQI